jgi:hypothetical protein
MPTIPLKSDRRSDLSLSRRQWLARSAHGLGALALATLLAEQRSTRERLDAIFLAALARRPTADEVRTAEEFLTSQAKLYAAGEAATPDDARAWIDLCHMTFNLKEFIYYQ